jgi:serine/threonine-protein kinase
MSLTARLQAALGTGYRVDRELGGGGMSHVFVAEDVELGRKVVVKVLPPEMAAGVNADRFRREIKLAASLQHPHVVPLLHAGQADDIVWYTMPLVEGESLRAKIAREGELPVSEAVRILRDVADALSYAHSHGVVHRDIKPDNVLLSGHHAVVTDFGVAKAVTEATGAASLTSLGVALGTPAYMAPEQAAAEPHVDHRADIYALGAMAYELLTGRPPFAAPTAQAVLAAHVTQAPDPITKHRATVPPPLAALVMRCLEKKPADRWQVASEIHAQLETMATPSGGTTPTAATPAAVGGMWSHRALRGRVAAAVILVLAGALALWRVTRGGAAPIDANLVAVLPFRVAGADPALHYLREGMIDLLAAKLTGEGGPRAADPRTVTAAFRRAGGDDATDLSQQQATAMARGIGAGQALLGAVVGSATHVTMSATVVTVPSGETRAQASVEGRADSLPALVDALTAQLLLRGAGVAAQREASLTTQSLPALKAYLAGQRAYRRGDYDSAAVHYSNAVGHDSGFVLAEFGLLLSYGWGAPVRDVGRVRQLAWDGRDRISPRERALLEAFVGPRFPEPAFQADMLEARERVVTQYGDVADAWYLLADIYFHMGRYLGHRDWTDRAAAAFERAVALDSAFAGVLSHLINLAAWRDDTTGARRYDRLYSAAVTRGGTFDHLVRWDLARTLRDPAGMREFWAGFDTSAARPEYMADYMLGSGAGLATVDSALDILARRASDDDARSTYHDYRAQRLANGGRPRAALAHADSMGGSELARHAWRLTAATWWDADSTIGLASATRLAVLAAGPLPGPGAARAEHLWATCALAHWRLARGEASGAAAAGARLRSFDAGIGDSPRLKRNATLCADALDAGLAVATRRSDALRLVERVDSIMRRGPRAINDGWLVPFENLLIGRLYAVLGDPAKGLAAVQRGGQWGVDWITSTYLREEGRLAALTGDRETAIRAYNRYLELRADPEPAVKPIVDEVRAELGRLMGSEGGRQ